MHHLLQQSKGLLPLLALLTCTNACISTHYIWCQQLVQHLLEQAKGFLPLLVTLTCTQSCISTHYSQC